MNHGQMQEFFDMAATGLANQGFARATADGGKHCVYEDDKGYRCAFGHLLSETELAEIRDEGMLSLDVFSLSRTSHWPEEIPATDEDVEFYRQLQRCHDAPDTPGEMVERLVEFATHYGLDTSVLDEAFYELVERYLEEVE